eukprot:3928740-Lingulodinium_polyedra.AAC.1
MAAASSAKPGQGCARRAKTKQCVPLDAGAGQAEGRRTLGGWDWGQAAIRDRPYRLLPRVRPRKPRRRP